MFVQSLSKALRHVRNLGAKAAWVLGGTSVLMVCVVARYYGGAESAKAAPPTGSVGKGVAQQPAGAPTDGEQKLAVVAVVNGEPIGRNDLAREALRHYGQDVLAALINKYLIQEQCKARGLTIGQDEVGAEIQRMAERFGLSVDNWLKMLEEERGITPVQYARDIIWPSIALRRLADSRLQVSEEEVQQAYETQFGPQVQIRLISIANLQKARDVHAQALKTPDNFGNLAKEFSEDINSASAKGLVQPLRKHLGDPKLQVAFSMQPGQVSDLIAIDNQYVFIRCEQHIPGRPMPMEQVHKLLVEACRDKKLRLVATDVFAELQKNCRLINYYSDPSRQAEAPGIAAVINDRKITMLELAEECIDRNGKQVLEGTINRRLLEQAIKAQKMDVTPADLDAEINRAAIAMGKVKPDGTVDLESWLQEVLGKQKLSFDVYRDDIVWPSVALKKLVAAHVEVTKEDMQRGFEANFGPRVDCLAIVFNQPRKAQEVWEMARNHPTPDFFGNLAEEYSIEPSSRALRGEIPPIQMNGGQPLVEKEAFLLAPGEISGVIQVDDKYVILFCRGRTKPIDVKFEEVRQQIQDDILEKKQRLAMGKEFHALQDNAQIDNFLAGTTQSPNKGRSADKWQDGPIGPQQAGPAARTAAAPQTPPPANDPQQVRFLQR